MGSSNVAHFRTDLAYFSGLFSAIVAARIARVWIMIVANLRSIPTQFAIIVATECDLFVPESEELGNEELWMELRDRLSNFQKMALSTDFESSLIAYHKYELSEAQLDQLKLIHKSTRKWILGHVAEQLLHKLESSITSHKESKEIAESLIELIRSEDLPEGEKKKKQRGMLVSFANIPEKHLEEKESESE